MITVHIDHFLIEHIQTNQKEFSSDQIHISSLAQHHNTNDTITIELRTICMQRGLDFNDWRFYVKVVGTIIHWIYFEIVPLLHII